MTDYSTWKVTDLKAELKRRGIPQTGLRVKQQIIDRLVEEDSKAEPEAADEASTAPEQDTHEESQPIEPEPAKTEKADEEPAQDSARDVPNNKLEVKTADEEPTTLDEKPVEPEPATADTADNEPTQDTADDVPEGLAEPKTTGEKSETADEKPVDSSSQSPPPHDKRTDQHPQPSQTEEPREPPETAENVVPSGAPTSGMNTEVSTPLPADELIEDVRKRKRRSRSPPPQLEELTRKRAKAMNDAESQSLTEVKTTTRIAGAPKAAPPGLPESTTHEAQPTETGRHYESPKSVPQKQDVRFKGLFTGPEPNRPASPHADTEMEDVEVTPALHVATAALYIDGLMRPLQPAALKAHIISAASIPGTPSNPDIIVDFYLDSIKTHCFVKFIDVSTASRARSSLHGTIWPNERNRKNLFVDFIPENRVQEWVQREEEARGRSGPPPRWEVKYDPVGETIEAVLEEVDSKSAGSHAPRGSAVPAPAPALKEFTHPPPRGPRADMKSQDRGPSGPSQAIHPQPGQGFKPLDELFKSTTTKPKLYYLPVSRDIADKRLDRFDDLLHKGSFPRRGGDETRRISFEDDDQFIDIGPEYANRGRGGGRGRGRGGMRRDNRRDRQ
ncbi:hypothetical protein BJX99DRAFT_248190 [Aspergillus californicus]